MAPHPEARRQPSAIHRRAQQPFAQRPPVAVEIVGIIARGREAVGLEQPIAGREAGELELGVARQLAIRVPLPPIDRLKPVAGLDVALEVDVPAQELDHGSEGGGRQTGLDAGGIEAVLDRGGDGGQLAAQLALDAAGGEAAVGRADQVHFARRADRQDQPGQQRLRAVRRVELQRQPLPDLEPA